MKYLDWLDMLMFAIMLAISAIIGVYFAYFASEKQNTTSQYLMGGRTIGIFPISMSLVASYISGISILGLPAEMYVYGTQFSMVILSEILVNATIVYVYLPVFYKLQITSSYEYLNLRFNSTVKLLGSFLFLMKQMLYIPIVIYVPALAFNQVTGINIYLITPAVCLVCIFYTTLGGMKAVVWTDTLQILIMMLGVIAVLIIGLWKIGGFIVVYNRADASDRLEFLNTDFDPTTRHTIWSIVIGNYFYWLATCSVDQAIAQRFLALPNIRKAYMAAAIFALGIVIIITLCCFTGLVIYATYYACDPLVTQKIKKSDQLLPLFVMEMAENVPGLPGIFLSGVFSAALSTMSTGLNSMTGVIYEDIIKPTYKKPISESKASFIMKIVTVINGIICVILVFGVEKLGTLIQAGRSLSGITAGPLLGIFSLGMFFPWANSKGALTGGLISLIFVAWLSFNSQKHIALGNIVFPKKPVSVTDCPNNDVLNKINITAINLHESRSSNVLYIYKLSYLWYTFIGCTITLVVGIIISYISNFNDIKNVDKDLLTPVIHKFLPKNDKKTHNESKKTNKIYGLKETSL